MPQEAGHFDICGPLPEAGVTILEASAGTGKTFTIAALVTRLVAEGVVTLSEILAVTFTRMATGELRDRVRERLVTAERGLGRLLDAGERPPADDLVLGMIAEGGPEVVARRRQRLADALASFDAATITTTHGFCHMVLAALGVWGEVADGATLLEDPTDLVEEVVDDLFVRHVLLSGKLPFRRRLALEAGLSAVRTPDAPIEPPPDPADTTPAGLRRRLGAAARAEVGRRLLDANLLTYDDLLVRLADALSDDERGPTACRRLRERYGVVLVDEFQDTDPLQWKVVRQAFGDGRTRLVLIGDPKQAVYSFRGADVYAYLDAARAADPRRRFTLEENWRSDAGLLEAYDALLSPLHLGHPEIVYRRAYATPAHRLPGLEHAPVAAPLRVRLVQRSERTLVPTRTGLLQKDAAVKYVAEDLAGDVVDLLASGARLVRWAEDGHPELAPRDVGPGDIGVLVRTNRQASIVQASLRAAGIPVVVAGALSVLSTPAARDWLRLLEALEQPDDALTGRIRGANPVYRHDRAATGRGQRNDLGGVALPSSSVGRPDEAKRSRHPLRPHPGQRTSAGTAAGRGRRRARAYGPGPRSRVAVRRGDTITAGPGRLAGMARPQDQRGRARTRPRSNSTAAGWTRTPTR